LELRGRSKTLNNQDIELLQADLLAIGHHHHPAIRSNRLHVT
jgi:hypothetical protein